MSIITYISSIYRIIYYLSNNRIKDINFMLEDALSYDGNTGPYVQYTYARACSILEKAGVREDMTVTADDIKLTDPLDAAQPGEWITIDLGSSILVARRLDPLSTGASVSDLVKGYDLLTAMKSSDMQNEMYAAGAALEHNLDASAIKTYAASKIKKNV